jgi:perosamine synthetase
MNKMNEFPLMDPSDGIPLFYPHVPSAAAKYVADVLSTRWIGQGPKVEEFESKFTKSIVENGWSVAVNSGTSALHLAYILAGVTQGSEVICPVFTCTATNLPILYQGGTPVFVDISKSSLNMDINVIEKLINSKTVAVCVVDYGGLPNDYKRLREICDKNGLKLIIDCAHAVDTLYNGKHVTSFADYVVYSFQAIKTMTTGDGGMLIVKSESDYEKARRLRWFGIDRSSKQKGIWENDITELGYKYQMTDISAAIGLASLEELAEVLNKRRMLYKVYQSSLEEFGDFLMEKPEKGVDFTPWLVTLNTNGNRLGLMRHLRKVNIESAQVHYRNDRYSVFRNYVKGTFPNMDKIEDHYLVLPLHTMLSAVDVEGICNEVKKFLRTN